MKLTAAIAGIATLTFGLTAGAATFPPLRIIPVDPLEKVFRDSEITSNSQVAPLAEVARGQHAEYQLTALGGPVPLYDLRCEVTSFTLKGAAPIDAGPIRFVGYVGSSYTAGKPAHDQLRKAPAMFPDPLLEQPSIDVHENDNQPIWISTPVPVDATPGDYKATATISAKIFGARTTQTLVLNLKVYPATVTSTRLNVVHWFQMWHRGDQPMPEKFSEEWWKILRVYADDLVAHRNNWARVETLWLVKFGRGADGKLTFDYSNFDRWVQTLLDAGVKNIEGLQFAWRGGKWEEPYVVEIHDENDKTSTGTKVAADSPEAEKFFSQFFPDLQAHLKEKGWLEKYHQHVGDEPVKQNADSYTTAAMYVRKYMPGVPIIEACLNREMVGMVDIWIPTIEHLDKDFAFFSERKKAGDRVWFYNCVQPQGEYANRFAELSLAKLRLTYWVNFRYDIEGYLHWGYNFWRKTPWEDIASGTLPGGDSHIVYPAKDGYGIVSSIRWEALRDGIEDHELLSQFAEKDKDAAMELAKRHVINWSTYNTDLRTFRATRRELLKALSGEK